VISKAVQTELHRHLDVSLRTETLLRLAQERGLEKSSMNLAEFRQKIIMSQPLTDLNAVLDAFTYFQKVLDHPDVLEQIAFEVVEDCYQEGTRKVELRFSPSFACGLSKLPWDHALDGFEAGLQRAIQKYPEMKAGLLCIGSREFGPESVDETVEFFLKHQDRFVGIDLAGHDGDFPSKLFEPSFKKAIKVGARITIHAGESTGPETIWEAIELLGAERIGHGIACVQDPKLMEFLRDRQICLEMCPTSNWLTQCVPAIEAHPLPQVLRAGVPVCINTDDPGMFGVTLQDEIRNCKTRMGMSEAEIEQCMQHADQASFI